MLNSITDAVTNFGASCWIVICYHGSGGSSRCDAVLTVIVCAKGNMGFVGSGKTCVHEGLLGRSGGVLGGREGLRRFPS